MMKTFSLPKNLWSLAAMLLLICCYACDKKWLDEKANKEMVIPASLKDFQSMMDVKDVNWNHPSLGEAAADDYYTTEIRWNNNFTSLEKNAYSWTRTYPITTTVLGNWDFAYSLVLLTNIVLEGLQNLQPASAEEKEQWKHIQAQALYHRARSFYLLSELYAPPYNAATAAKDLSIPLRVHTDVTVPSKRSTVKETYEMIVHDLMIAAEGLPDKAMNDSRPNRPAAYALLARLYLGTQQFDSSLKYADKCLQIKNDLLDFNTLNVNAASIGSNKEIIFHDFFNLNMTIRYVNEAFYNTYEDNDLRKKCYFRVNTDRTITFKGNY
ncbi:MAG: RagB/SusD family nutrient uptake outer membrane protein, partial [Chitinophagaceae bacterium]|nr:RagB/SusD family nutrient uptake outer membrane protein [Chitinophagaceae bacterium]